MSEEKKLVTPIINVTNDDNYEAIQVPLPSGKFAATPVINDEGGYITQDDLNAEINRAKSAEGQLLAGVTANAEEIAACNEAFNTYQDTMGAGTGFVDRNQCELIFSENPYKLTIKAKDMNRGFDIAFHGRIYTKFEDEIDVDWTGNRYIIYTDDGAGLTSIQYPDSLDHIIVSYIYFNPNSEVPYVLAADERHQSMRNPISHYLHHREFGATWLSGGSVHYHINGDDDPEIELDSVGLSDEGLEFTIKHADEPYSTIVSEGILEQNLHPLRAPVLYQDENGVWATDTINPDCAIKVNANGIPTFNNQGGTNIQTPLADREFVSYWICSTNSKIYPIKLVQGNHAHYSEDECLADEFKSLGLPMPEIIAMWQVIYQYSTEYIGENNPYGIKIISIRSPKRTMVGGEQYFGNNTHAALAGREQSNSHPTAAINDINRQKPLDEILDNIDEEIRRVALLTENGRNRGQVDNAFISQGELLTITAISITDGGSGYAVNDLIYVDTPDKHRTAVMRVMSILEGGVISSVSLGSGGAYHSLDNYTISTNGSGSGFTSAIQTVLNPMTVLADVKNPRQGDYVYVSEDESHSDDTWLYYWADEDGDGNYGWVPIIRVNEQVRDFEAQPITINEIEQSVKDKINGSVQQSQIKTDEPTSGSEDGDIISAKTLWGILGTSVGNLITTTKNIIGAINELVNKITNLTYEDLAQSDTKGLYAQGQNLSTGQSLILELSDVTFFVGKTSASAQFQVGILNTSMQSKQFVYHLSHQYSGTLVSRYYGHPTISSFGAHVMHDLINYGGDCAFYCYITNLTDNKFYKLEGQAEENNIRIFARLLGQ
jgi:hypothetical protein